MTGYFLRRLGQMLLVIVGVTFVTFLIMQVLGDPVRLMLPLQTNPKIIERVRDAYGFNRPVLVQYWDFLTSAVRGDFGQSLSQHQPALQAALSALPHTLVIVVPASLIGVSLGSMVGLVAGLRAGSVADKAISTSSYLFISIAEFWLALMLIYVFAGQLGWLAVGGYGIDVAHLVLPICVLAVVPFAYTVQVMRNSVISESRLPYVLTALATGVSWRRVALRDILPNASIPVMTVSIYNVSLYIFASAAVEVVFAWPGIGRLAYNALSAGDVFLVEAIVVISSVIIIGLNLIGDLVALRLDPRTRTVVEGGAG